MSIIFNNLSDDAIWVIPAFLGLCVFLLCLVLAKRKGQFLGKQTQKDFYVAGLVGIFLAFSVVAICSLNSWPSTDLLIFLAIPQMFYALFCAQILLNRCLFALWRKIFLFFNPDSTRSLK
jgi:uncharacterized membrane protein (GlpM family)